MAAALVQTIHRIDWKAIARSLDETGHAVTGPLLDTESCARIASSYAEDRLFRKRVDMDRHGFGSGTYAYYGEPLPRAVGLLRERIYEGLAPIANDMTARLGRSGRFPPDLDAYRRRCARAGQSKPTPLVLRYVAGGYNRLHRDLYGDLVFPLQATLMLSRPGEDFEGGEFLLIENRPRQQSIGTVVRLRQGEAVIFPVAERPVEGARSIVRAQIRHGVSRITHGERYTLGIIFHDAA